MVFFQNFEKNRCEHFSMKIQLKVWFVGSGWVKHSKKSRVGSGWVKHSKKDGSGRVGLGHAFKKSWESSKLILKFWDNFLTTTPDLTFSRLEY